jgi:hypothetical protein
VKVSARRKPDSKNWVPKHRLAWESANGKIPKGHKVIFADGDKSNFSLGNLLLVSGGELGVMNRFGLKSSNGDLTKAGKTVANIRMAIAARRKGESRGR